MRALFCLNITFATCKISRIFPNKKNHFSYLNHNKLHWTIEDANGVFSGPTNLQKFLIASNNIKSINKNAFLGLKNLVHLDLNDNNVTSIQKNAFAEMSSLKVFVMNTSSLLCDCNIHWFYDWLNTMDETIKSASRVVCGHPEWLRNQSLLEVPPNNFTCDDLVKPRLVEQPAVEIMALKDENISLTCKGASKSPDPMVFQWKKDNKDLISGANSNISVVVVNEGKLLESISTLSIYKAQQFNAGKYQCVVSNRFGTTYSNRSTISVLSMYF